MSSTSWRESGEAQPGAAVATGGGRIGLREGFEDGLLIGAGDTDPGVDDLDANPGRLAARRGQLQPDLP